MRAFVLLAVVIASTGCAHNKFSLTSDPKRLHRQDVVADVTCIERHYRHYYKLRDQFKMLAPLPRVRWSGAFRIDRVLQGTITNQGFRLTDAKNPLPLPGIRSFYFESNQTYRVSFDRILDGDVRGLKILITSNTVQASSNSPATTVKTVTKMETTASPPFNGFPIEPPIPSANPLVRHPITVRVPTRLDIQRTENSLTIALSAFQATNLTVGTNMVTGFESTQKVYPSSQAPPQGGLGLLSGLDLESHLESYNYMLTRNRDKIPQPGVEYVVEYRLTLFETDLPPQHMWSPGSGKHYRVLWTRTFKEVMK